jgi:hypothetical protein
MTQFSPAPLLRGARPGGAFLNGQQLQNAIQTDSLQVFNVPAVGAIDQGNDLAELRQAFGLVGQVTQAAGQVSAEERSRQEVSDKGEAFNRSSLDNIDVARSFDEDPNVIPDGVKPSEYASSLVEAQIETQYASKSEAWKQAYRKNATDKIADMARVKLGQRQNVKNAEAMNGFGEMAYNGDVDEALAGARALPGITEQQVYAGVILPGLKTAAATGNEKVFARLASALPEGTFATDVDPLRARLEAAKLSRQSDQYEQANAMILGMLDNGMPLDAVRSAVDALNENQQLAPGRADQWRDIIDNRADAVRKDAAMQQGASIIAAAQSGTPYTDSLASLATSDPDVYDRILPHVQRAEKEYVTRGYIEGVQSRVQAGVPLASIVDEELELPSGGTVKVSGEETQKRVMEAELSRIDATSDMMTRLPRVIDWSRENGVYPPEFDRELKIGVSQAGRVATGGQPSPATMNALNTWKEIRERDPNWARGVTDPKTRRFLDAALDNMKVAGGDPAVAIRLAVEGASVSEDVQAFRRKQVFDKVVERAGRNTLGLDTSSRNSHQVLERLRAIAEAKADFGMPADLAVSEAAEEIKASTKLINGAYVNMDAKGLTPPLRDNFEQLSMSIINEYVGESGADTDDFAFELVPGRDDLWSVRKRGLPAADPDRRFTYTSAGLIARFEEDKKRRQDAGKDRIDSGIKSRETRTADNALIEYERSVINPY